MPRSRLTANDTGILLPAITRDPHPGVLRWVLHFIYDLAWVVTAIVGVPFLLWKHRRRQGFGAVLLERLGRGFKRYPKRGERRRVLVHGVSVGEVKGALPIVRELEAARPDLEVVVSTSTETGTAIARQLFPNHLVVHFPVDITWVVKRFMRAVDPASVVLVELEIWPNFLRVANRLGIPVAVVNGRITEQSFRSYRWSKGFLPQFNRISLFCAQGREYSERFLELHVDPERVIETGNVKADGLRIGRAVAPQELARLLHPDAEQPVLVAGSTHEDEELQVARAARAALSGWRVVLVPRHPKRVLDLMAALAAEGFAAQRLTELRAGLAPDPDALAVVDTIGELDAVFALADLAFVGGSLVPRGGQNMLEPAAQGVPVVVGPHLQNFTQEARILREAGALEVLDGPGELRPALARLAADPERREAMGRAGMAATAAQQGAARKTITALEAVCLPPAVGASSGLEEPIPAASTAPAGNSE